MFISIYDLRSNFKNYKNEKKMKVTGSKLIKVLIFQDGYVEYDVDRHKYYVVKKGQLQEMTEAEYSIFKSSCKVKEDVANKSNLR